MEPYVELFTKNFKNFKIEINRLIDAYKFDFTSSTLVNIYFLEDKTGQYFFFEITYCNIIDDECDEKVSQLYPVNFEFQNHTLCRDLIDTPDGLEPIFVLSLEGYMFKYQLSEENKELLKELKSQISNLKLEKFKIEHELIGIGITDFEKRKQYIQSQKETRLPQLIQNINNVQSFIDDINDGTF